jgi:hypothetical protein
VKLFDEWDRFIGFVLRFIERSELGVEGGVVGMLLECRRKERFGLLAFSLPDEEMDESCSGLGVVGIGCEETAIGGFSGGCVVGGFGKLTGKKDIVGGLGGELDGVEKLIARAGGVPGLVEPGQGAVGAGAEGGISVGNCCGGSEFGMGFRGFAGAGEEEAESEMRLKQIGRGRDGATVGGFSLGGVVEGILSRA